MKVVIFGNRDMSQLAHYYLTHDSNHVVSAFCLDGKYIKENTFCGLPVVPFEEIEKTHPSHEYFFFAPLYASNMNQLRFDVYNKIKEKGYQFINYIHSTSIISGKIGDNCFVFENVHIQPFTEVGNNNIIWSGTHIGHHGKIGNHIFMSSLCIIAGHINMKDFCYVGSGATFRDGLNIAEKTFVGQSACVVKDIDISGGVYIGIPAKRTKEISEIEL